MANWTRILRTVARPLRRVVRNLIVEGTKARPGSRQTDQDAPAPDGKKSRPRTKQSRPSTTPPRPDAAQKPAGSGGGTAGSGASPRTASLPYPGTAGPHGGRIALPDFEGPLTPVYAADADGEPDPGEVVWTWVAFEDNPQQGKDRPVLLVGHDDPWLLALMLTSKDHDRDIEDEQRWGRYWFDLGSGPWDRKGRPSEVRLDRVLRIDPAAIRREGSILDRARWDQVMAALSRVPHR